MSELQARIRQLNEFTIYVRCAGHSSNLVGVKAEECSLEIIKFFNFVQCLYSFVSVSTHRWNVLKSALGKYHVVVKRTHFWVLTQDVQHNSEVCSALRFWEYLTCTWFCIQLTVYTDQEVNTRQEAEVYNNSLSFLCFHFCVFQGLCYKPIFFKITYSLTMFPFV